MMLAEGIRGCFQAVFFLICDVSDLAIESTSQFHNLSKAIWPHPLWSWFLLSDPAAKNFARQDGTQCSKSSSYRAFVSTI
jgi:hypothetical protein